ncbi:MAG: threonine synthase [Rikenellaceae bacterium]|jgi:threonine synthase|nr:threonine synthase [Rikenellaceae bacterium]
MRYYSTNRNSPEATLADAVINGLAPDRGLYMPEAIDRLPDEFFAGIGEMTFHQIACRVAQAFFGDDVPQPELDNIVCDTLSFDTPVVPVHGDIYSLELFHGPTLAFKDVGARFMARMLAYFIGKKGRKEKVTVLVATSGDTGSAVANGFLGVDGIDVVVLYPSGKVSEIQEKQFTTLGRNITAVEVTGTFDDCQALVKSAFMDADLNAHMRLTSANSINVARFLPQAFYYFNAWAQLQWQGLSDEVVMCVPSGNLGNLTAGLFAHRMGLPVKRFMAANNCNDVFLRYLESGKYDPKGTITTIANAMDVGDPSNFARIIDIYGGSHERITQVVSGYSFPDEKIREAVREVYEKYGYLMDPHGAVGYLALQKGLRKGERGVFLETAHPAKFLDTVQPIIGKPVEIPARLEEFMHGTRHTLPMSSGFDEFKQYLLSR